MNWYVSFDDSRISNDLRVLELISQLFFCKSTIGIRHKETTSSHFKCLAIPRSGFVLWPPIFKVGLHNCREWAAFRDAPLEEFDRRKGSPLGYDYENRRYPAKCFLDVPDDIRLAGDAMSRRRNERRFNGSWSYVYAGIGQINYAPIKPRTAMNTGNDWYSLFDEA
jgi:hypothetical protein